MDHAARPPDTDRGGSDGARGRRARRPTEVPKEGWLDIFWRMKRQVNEDNLAIVSAGVAL